MHFSTQKIMSKFDIFLRKSIEVKVFLSYTIYLSSSLENFKILKFVATTNYFLHGPQIVGWF